MLLTVLSVPGCPNAPGLVDLLRARIDDRTDDLAVIVVADDERARSWGMTGSPTLLVDGSDPFAAAGTDPSISCRLYRSTDGTVGGAPSVADLEAILNTAHTADKRSSGGWSDAVGRAGQGRRAPVERGLRAVQTAAIRAIAGSGNPPGVSELDQIAEVFGRRGADALRELAAEDYLTLDAVGRLRAVYPFSTVASRHRVRIEGGPDVWAMCAIDALGVASMLNRTVIITTTDPITADPISVRATPDDASSNPPGTVVFAGSRSCDGPAEQICCDAINFFGSRHSATRWAARHPDVRGEVMDLGDAALAGQAIFGRLLKD
ncbi:alkylmercury lyase family protein [Sporichthya sp.]|uniref:alkylmercury lyase family protein n=1 Tax=Sporichthya sp. TaxID=65475 RepID=UPI0017F4BBE9|nr:alkylmercury lyase family protein [Sporichthya sp.]MBA3744957.1 alkylmercury lyase family protein [Sporichthya sp.]